VLAATAAVTAVFSSTPFLIPVLAETYGVSEGLAGAISVAQVGGFTVANVVFPRWTAASGKFFRWGLAVLALANLSSVFAPGFSVLVVVRGIAGTAAGVVTWVSWVEGMRTPRSIASISMAGPLAALIAAPAAAALSGIGAEVVFIGLAVACIPAAVLAPPRIEASGRVRSRSRSRSNRFLLGALWLSTLAGSALFIYQTIVARELLALDSFAVSLGFSLNALAGLVGARLSKYHRRPGVFLASAGPAALLTVLGGHPVWFFLGMAWWGFAFWMGVPGVMEMLAARSLSRGERAGDAQGALALGRTIGPVIGGGFVDANAYGGLAIISATGLTLAGLAVVGVQEGRELLPPTDHRWRTD
jgi:predicted MFS family arabinose efflux permease